MASQYVLLFVLLKALVFEKPTEKIELWISCSLKNPVLRNHKILPGIYSYTIRDHSMDFLKDMKSKVQNHG